MRFIGRAVLIGWCSLLRHPNAIEAGMAFLYVLLRSLADAPRPLLGKRSIRRRPLVALAQYPAEQVLRFASERRHASRSSLTVLP